MNISLWISAVSNIVAMNHTWLHKVIKIDKLKIEFHIDHMWLVAITGQHRYRACSPP